MKKGPRYEVQTRYGWFSLDEASYQDYLVGKLWITWPPEKGKEPPKQEYAPKNISKQALELRAQADKFGVYPTAEAIYPASPCVPYTPRMANWSIDELTLSVRSSNGLLRAGMNTFGKLASGLNQEGGLFRIRNLGVKSEREIRTTFVEECYSRMNPYEKAEYWQHFLDARSLPISED